MQMWPAIHVTTVEQVIEALHEVTDPEIPIPVTDPRIGIVRPEYVKVEDQLVNVVFKPTAAYCPMGGLIGVLIRHKLEEKFPDHTIRVRVLPGSHAQEQAVNDMISDDEKYNNIVAQLRERGMV